jgi:hypothetical protein
MPKAVRSSACALWRGRMEDMMTKEGDTCRSQRALLASSSCSCYRRSSTTATTTTIQRNWPHFCPFSCFPPSSTLPSWWFFSAPAPDSYNARRAQMKKGGLLLHGKKRQEIQHDCRLYYFVAGATDFCFFAPGALWAVSSTGIHSTAGPYLSAALGISISYLISSSTIY